MELNKIKKDTKKNPLNDKWTHEQEELLAEWAEKASCYRWLHSRSEKRYRCRNYTFTIPVIILSTLSGTANFGMDSFVPEEHKKTAMATVGSVNIIAGIISTLANFLRYAELMESHRSCGVSWSKLGRDISVELALDPKRRKPAGDFLKICRAEYDRLIEQSPLVDDSILEQFNSNFGTTDINKPEMCNGLDKCEIYKPPKEEKIAEVLATAGTKFAAKSWKKIDVKSVPIVEEKNKYKPDENKNEIHGLKSLGKVSAFKNAINKETVTSNVVDEIKEINLVDESVNKKDLISKGEGEEGEGDDKEGGEVEGGDKGQAEQEEQVEQEEQAEQEEDKEDIIINISPSNDDEVEKFLDKIDNP